MIIKLSYVASDGRKFKTEEECILHEVAINPKAYDKFPNGVIMFHRLGRPINDGKNRVDEVVTFFECTAIMVFDKEKAEEFFAGFKASRTSTPDTTPGMYVLDTIDNTWKRVLTNSANAIETIVERYFKKY